VVAFAVLCVVQLAAPASASALPSPLDLVPGGGDLPSLDPTQWVVDGFRAILKFIFGESIDSLGRHLVGLLLAVPLITDHRLFPGLNAYHAYVTGGAWGLLGLTFVVAIMRYWLSSFSGSGSYEALTGFVRGCGAIVMLLLFVPAFDGISRAVNMFTAALIAGPTQGSSDHGLMSALAPSSIADGGIAMLVTIAAIIMAIVLLVVKVIVVALLAVLFAASPLAIALWPVEELGWLLRSLVQALGALLIFPILWALCFGVFSVLPKDALFPGSYGDVINSVLSPLITLAALIIAFKLPFVVLQQAIRASILPNPNRAVSTIRNVSYVRSMTRSGA
jgi:hypothetical protein